MKAILLCVLVALTLSQTYLVLSDPHTTTITNPPGQTVGISAHHTANQPNWQGSGAQWIFNDANTVWPRGYSATFQALFQADCTSDITLRITADNSFHVWLNKNYLGNGDNWNKNYIFNSTVKCGLNNLTVTVTNGQAQTPAGLIFTVLQNQDACYSCESPSAFYNRNTCQCQCTNKCNCPKPYAWRDDICGCDCPNYSRCRPNQYFDRGSCSCKCAKKHCPLASQQDPNTCQCVGTCRNVAPCPIGTTWDTFLCKCIKDPTPSCQPSRACQLPKALNKACKCACPDSLKQPCLKNGNYFNVSNCACIKRPDVQCAMACLEPFMLHPTICKCVCQDTDRQQCVQDGGFFNEQSCLCSRRVCKILCLAPFVAHPNQCKCVCPESISRTCGFPLVWNQTACACQKFDLVNPNPACPPNRVYDAVKKECVCQKKVQCSFPFVFSEGLCACRNTCDYIEICPKFQRWDISVCKCVNCPASGTCSLREFWDRQSCSCKSFDIVRSDLRAEIQREIQAVVKP